MRPRFSLLWQGRGRLAVCVFATGTVTDPEGGDGYKCWRKA